MDGWTDKWMNELFMNFKYLTFFTTGQGGLKFNVHLSFSPGGR